MHWLAAIFLMVSLISPAVPRFTTQAGPSITDRGVQFEFGKQVTFRVSVQPVTDVEKLLVYITPDGQATVWLNFDLGSASAQGDISQVIDIRQLAISPFSRVYYRYEAVRKDGQKADGPSGSFQYDDTRFTWQSLQSGIFQIHWYGDDPALGQMIANIAQDGLRTGQSILDVTPPAPVRIYAYNSSRDMQSALQMANSPWVGGHTTPELGLIIIWVPAGPEKKLEIGRKVPHEIMHILQYQVMGSSFIKQPAWLVEGMAALAEVYPDPEYRTVLNESAKGHSLYPLRSLCSSFPDDSGAVFQAYAQSESFVRFLNTKYGAPGLRNLINQYQDGLGCEEGFSAAMGVSLGQMETRWQQETLGINIGGLVLTNLSPYLLIGLLLLFPAAMIFIPYRTKKNPAGKTP